MHNNQELILLFSAILTTLIFHIPENFQVPDSKFTPWILVGIRFPGTWALK